MKFVEENPRLTIILIIRGLLSLFSCFILSLRCVKPLSCFKFVDLEFWLYFGHGSYI